MRAFSSSGMQIDVDELYALRELKDASFTEKCRSLGLNPRTDFRHSDLRRVDLSHSDLSDFDFSGSDLRGAFGVCVTWNRTTRFNDADLSGSCLARGVAIEHAFHGNDGLRHLYLRIKGDDWAKRNAWILQSGTKTEQNRIIAQKLFLDDISIVDQSSFALALHRFFESADDYYEYLLYVAAAPNTRLSATKAALKALGAHFLDRQTTIDLMTTYLKHADRDLRSISLSLIFKSGFWRNSLPDVMNSLRSEEDVGIRRLFAGLVGHRLGPLYDQLLRDPELDGQGYLDFREPITEQKLLRMLTLLKRNSEAAARLRDQYERLWSARAEKDEIMRRRYLELITMNLHALSKLGLSFSLIETQKLAASLLINVSRTGADKLAIELSTDKL